MCVCVCACVSVDDCFVIKCGCKYAQNESKKVSPFHYQFSMRTLKPPPRYSPWGWTSLSCSTRCCTWP